MPRPRFTIKNRFQKRGVLYEEILTKEVLRDVCRRVTGREDFTVTFDDEGYNKGRLAVLEYDGSVIYISFSEVEIRSRNSFFQSFPSALLQYHQEVNPHKRICFYFIEADGNIETAYFAFMYRLMATAGTEFLNADDYLHDVIIPFNSVSDIIVHRNLNRRRNPGNASTYVTLDENGIIQIYGKTYGANKYETTLLCLAIQRITTRSIELYEIAEGGLAILPALAREVVTSLGIRVIKSDLVLERTEYEVNNSLRSPTFMYNLLEKLGEKKCVLCNCEIPQIVQGAHVWPVASIKNADSMSVEDRLRCATDGDNGLWLCNNHHRLLDMNLLLIASDGRLKHISDFEPNDVEYLRDVTTNNHLSGQILNPAFIEYLQRRNASIDERLYSYV